MKFDKRNISVDPDHEWSIEINTSGYKIVTEGAGINADRIIKPKSLDNKKPKDINIGSIYKKISRFLFKEDYRSMPEIYDNRPILKEHFKNNEDFISADEEGFLKIINEFGLLSGAEEESTEIWLSILKYIAHRGSYVILDDTRIPPYNLKSGYEVQLFESEVNQFNKINEQIKTIIKKDGFHLYASSLCSALILFVLKHNFPQVKKCQNRKGNCKEFFIDYTKAQKGLFCKSSCTREQNRNDEVAERISMQREIIEDILIPNIEKSGWSNSDIKMDYIINRRLKSRADLVLTYEDKPLVMIEVNIGENIEDKQKIGRAIRHAQYLKVRYLYICNKKSFFLTDLNKSEDLEIFGSGAKRRILKTWQVQSILSPEQARGLEDV